MNDIAARIAAAVGDPATLLIIAIELAQANAQLEHLRTEATDRQAADDARRAADAKRKREARGSSRPPMSTDVHGQGRTSADVQGPPSPQVSPSSPEPLITLSSPSSPASSSSAGQSPEEIEAENRLLDRTATARQGASRVVLLRFLGHWEGVGRVSWVGRLSALMDDPPHFTDEELVEGLEALMTEPRASWKPSVLKAWVKRVRTDASREAAKDAERAAAPPPSRNGQRPAANRDAGSDAGSMFAAIRNLVETVNHPGAGTRRVLPRAKVAELGDRVLKAYDNIGGADRFLADEKVGLVLRDFTREYGTLNGAHP